MSSLPEVSIHRAERQEITYNCFKRLSYIYMNPRARPFTFVLINSRTQKVFYHRYSTSQDLFLKIYVSYDLTPCSLVDIVTDLINAMPGNSYVNTVQLATIDEAVFSMSSASSNSRNGVLCDQMLGYATVLTKELCFLCGPCRGSITRFPEFPEGVAFSTNSSVASLLWGHGVSTGI
jgi:hypothetical protein